MFKVDSHCSRRAKLHPPTSDPHPLHSHAVPPELDPGLEQATVGVPGLDALPGLTQLQEVGADHQQLA